MGEVDEHQKLGSYIDFSIFKRTFGYLAGFNPSMFCGIPDDCLILGTVDSYGHLIVSRLDIVADGNFTILS